MSFLPREFVVPRVVETDAFRLRSITIHDVIKDYDAVMSSREHLWQRFGPTWGWPAEDLTIEQNLIDLGWHQKEFTLRSSFDYAVMALDEKRLLGCVYIDPPEDATVDAEVWFWARVSEHGRRLEQELGRFLTGWLGASWPFRSVRVNGERLALTG